MHAAQIAPPARIAVLGGTGFIGQVLAAELVKAGYRVRILTRRSTPVPDLWVLPEVEVQPWVQAADSGAMQRALEGCSAVVNLVGILHESGAGSFEDAHVALLRTLLGACQRVGLLRVIHVSALGASAQAPSRYLRSKAAGEAVLREAALDWTVLRPSVVFGRGDAFLNLFAGLLRLLPVVVLASPEARFQPVHVEDVARAIRRCLVLPATIAQVLELGGPKQYSLRELVTQVGVWIGCRRPILGLGSGLSMLQAALLELAPRPLMTRDNVRSMQVPNVCSGPWPAVLGFEPEALEVIVPTYLHATAGRARYGALRSRAGRTA